ncbi:uncharacterized protein LOC122723326 [Manihot esculenta]|uniref:uncharacterized protein LOC122723326 n=1 Tax=Manihot esculenta TaxID=3983 RepID=UPI001CC81EBC|nr:uncharacterized protein LOC122723326 [Manihot esculenta]
MEIPKLPEVFNLESYITPSTITKLISLRYLDTPLYLIRAPHLFRDNPPDAVPKFYLVHVFLRIHLPELGLYAHGASVRDLFPSFSELKKESGRSWGVELDWEDVSLGCNDLPQLSLTEQVGYLRLTSVDKKYDVEKCMFACNFRDIQDAASDVKMDQIKPPKNLVLSRESMNAVLDALRAGRHVSEATEEVAQVISSRTVSRPPALTSSRAPKSSSRGAKSSRPSSRSRSSSAVPSSQALASRRVSVPRAEETPQIAIGLVEGVELAKKDLAVPSGGISEEMPGTCLADVSGPGGEKETSPAGGDIRGDVTEVAPVIEEGGSGPANDEVVVEEVGSKRPPPSEEPAPAPTRKKSRASKGSAPALPPLEKKKAAPALPPLEKEKDVPMVPLMSASDNDILNAEDITHQSPASIVAKIIKGRMFGGVTEASDPRLLALTGLLANSTREQAAFRSRPRGELGDTIREMLLMVMGLFMEVDARDHSLRESIDRRIEEARLEENLSATSDARGNLAAAREHSKSLQIELHMFVSGFNRGLREARQAPSTPLAKLQAAEVDSDGEDVLYGEDDLPLPKGTSHTSAGPSDKDTELGEEDERAAEDTGPPGLEVVLYVGDGGSEQEGARPPTSGNANASIENNNVNSETPRNVSPLITIFPPIILDD